MGELENSFIQVDDRSLAAFDQPEWKIEQTPQSGELVIINAVEKDEKIGSLSASFVVTRDFDEAAGLFMEAGRAVHLSSVSVRTAYFWRGIGSALLKKMEELAINFGAPLIEGTISSADIGVEPWLPDFYRKNGYELEPKGEGFIIRKKL